MAGKSAGEVKVENVVRQVLDHARSSGTPIFLITSKQVRQIVSRANGGKVPVNFTDVMAELNRRKEAFRKEQHARKWAKRTSKSALSAAARKTIRASRPI